VTRTWLEVDVPRAVRFRAGPWVALTSALLCCAGKTQMTTPSSTTSDVTRPVIERWNGANPMMGAQPFLEFAAWRDGRAFRLEAGRPVSGRVRAADLDALLRQLERSGFFESELLRDVLSPDGGLRCVTVRLPHRTVRRCADRAPLSEHRDDVPAGHLPTRAQLEAFARAWNAALAGTEQLAIDPSTPFDAWRQLEFVRSEPDAP
jgi:hypothetical protein